MKFLQLLNGVIRQSSTQATTTPLANSIPISSSSGNLNDWVTDINLNLRPNCVFSANFGASNGWDLPNNMGSGFTTFNEEIIVNSDNSITLNGTSNYASCKYVRFPIKKATYHFKFKTTKTTDNPRLFACGSGNDTSTPQSNSFDCCIHTDTPTEIYLFIETGAGNNNALYYDTGFTLNNGNLYDIIITIDNDKLNIWVNGEHTNIDESFIQPDGAIWESLVLFANANKSATFFQGTVYSFDVFNGVLTESQIQDLISNGCTSTGYTASKSPSANSIPIADANGKLNAWVDADMEKSVYDTNNDGIVDNTEKVKSLDVIGQQIITSSSDSAAIDWNAGTNAIITLTENTTLTFTNPTSSCHLQLIIDQDATGGWTLTLPTGIYWVGKTAPTFTTTASGRDILTLYWDGNKYNAMIANNWGVV